MFQPNVQTVIENESALMLFEYYPIIDLANLSSNQNYLIAALLEYVNEHARLENVQIVQKSALKYQIQYIDFQEQVDKLLVDQFIEQNEVLSKYNVVNLKAYLKQMSNIQQMVMTIRTLQDFIIGLRNNGKREYKELPETYMTRQDGNRLINQLEQRGYSELRSSNLFNRALNSKGYSIEYPINLIRQLTTHASEEMSLIKCSTFESDVMNGILEICDKFLDGVFQVYQMRTQETQK